MGLYGGSARFVWRASSAASRVSANLGASAAQHIQIKRAARRAATGVIGPGDPPPPPNGPMDYYDYRGVATPRDARALRDKPFTLGRLLDPRRGARFSLGLSDSILEQHAVIVGPTGSGKTTSILVPWIAEALRLGNSVVAVDVAGDLLDDLSRYRAATGPFHANVAVWDFSQPNLSISWNWLADMKDESAISSAVEAIRGRVSPNDSQPFFHERDLRLLRAAIELSVASRQNMTAVDLLGIVRSEVAFVDLVRSHSGHPAASRIPDFISGVSQGRFAEMTSGVVNALELWDTSGLRRVSSRPELQLSDLLDTPSLLVVGAPLHFGRTSEVASGLILSQIVNMLFRRFSSPGPRRLFFVIDEAARLASRLNFEELLSIGRRAGATIVLALQDVSQLSNEAERLAILGNCGTMVSLPSRSKSTAEYFLSRLGNRPQASVTLTATPGSVGPRFSTAHGVVEVPVLGLREVMDPPWGPRSAVVHCQPALGRPLLVDLTRAL